MLDIDGTIAKGRDAIAKLYGGGPARSADAAPRPQNHMLLTNPVLDAKRNRATVYEQGREDSELVEVGGRWLISRRYISSDSGLPDRFAKTFTQRSTPLDWDGRGALMKLCFLTAMVLAAVVPAHAHHPFTPYYDASNLVSVTGVVVEFRVVNPHVTLIVEGPASDGRSGRWAFEGLPPNVFVRRGLTDFREKLRPGTRVTISGWRATDPAARALSGRELTFADGSTMLFGSTPEEANRWSCAPGPCSYTYPDVSSN